MRTITIITAIIDEASANPISVKAINFGLDSTIYYNL